MAFASNRARLAAPDGQAHPLRKYRYSLDLQDTAVELVL